jgi:hypothetical protein
MGGGDWKILRKNIHDIIAGKVHKSKGRTLFVVYVEPSKNKLGRFRNNTHLFTFNSCFLSDRALQ